MAELLHIPDTTDRAQRYAAMLPQLKALMENEPDAVANMANCCAVLRQTFGFFWVGFYLVKETRDKGQGTRDPSPKGTGDLEYSANPIFHFPSSDGQELVLGPFQGDVACTRIAFGKGVCGATWQRGETIVVPDVDAFPGHIACSSLSRSEIAIPLRRGQKVLAVLDVDSDRLDDFTVADKAGLEAVGEIMATLL